MALEKRNIHEWLGEYVESIELGVDLEKFENALLRCSMNKVLTKINVLGTLPTSHGTTRPANARLIISEDRCARFLWKTKFSQTFV